MVVGEIGLTGARVPCRVVVAEYIQRRGSVIILCRFVVVKSVIRMVQVILNQKPAGLNFLVPVGSVLILYTNKRYIKIQDINFKIQLQFLIYRLYYLFPCLLNFSGWSMVTMGSIWRLFCYLRRRYHTEEPVMYFVTDRTWLSRIEMDNVVQNVGH